MKSTGPNREWLKVKDAGDYAGGSSERTVRTWLARYGLRYVKVRGTILIKREWLDAFLERFEVNPKAEIDDLVNQVMEQIG